MDTVGCRLNVIQSALCLCATFAVLWDIQEHSDNSVIPDSDHAARKLEASSFLFPIPIDFSISPWFDCEVQFSTQPFLKWGIHWQWSWERWGFPIDVALWHWVHTVFKGGRQAGVFCVCRLCVFERQRELQKGRQLAKQTWNKWILDKDGKKSINMGGVYVTCVYLCMWWTVCKSVNWCFFFSAIRCLRVRSAGVSRAERCCALWQPAHRRSAWTRSTSRISAVPSARVVSGDDDFFQQASSFQCSWYPSGIGMKAPLVPVFAQGHHNRSSEVAKHHFADAKQAACCTAVCAVSCHIGSNLFKWSHGKKIWLMSSESWPVFV